MKKRITVTVPLGKDQEIAKLKEEKFQGKSNSDLFRYLMKEGLSDYERQGTEVK